MPAPGDMSVLTKCLCLRIFDRNSPVGEGHGLGGDLRRSPYLLGVDCSSHLEYHHLRRRAVRKIFSARIAVQSARFSFSNGLVYSWVNSPSEKSPAGKFSPPRLMQSHRAQPKITHNIPCCLRCSLETHNVRCLYSD